LGKVFRLLINQALSAKVSVVGAKHIGIFACGYLKMIIHKGLIRIKAKDKQNFQDSLPMDEELFWNLFDYVDEKLEANDGCDHSLTFTREFLETQKVDVESVLDWIINEGGGCDCEVLYNVEERFEEYR